MRLGERFFPIRWNSVTIFLLALAGIAPAVLMWHWVSTNWMPIPYWDEWATPGSQFESWSRGTKTRTGMFTPHNQSRNLVPRVV